MFTGIVLGCAKVISFAPQKEIYRLAIELPKAWAQDLQLGASVAINGACLSAVKIDGECVSFDLIPETLAKTNLADLRPGDSVHIERALRIGDELGGHQLSGHIYGQGTLINRVEGDGFQELTIQVPTAWMDYIIPKGYIALDGVSLTVVHTNGEKGLFTLQLIPETLQRTTLGKKPIGSALNIEIDYQTQLIVETVKQTLKRSN